MKATGILGGEIRELESCIDNGVLRPSDKFRRVTKTFQKSSKTVGDLVKRVFTDINAGISEEHL